MQQNLPHALAMATQHACHLMNQTPPVIEALHFQHRGSCFTQCLVLIPYLAMVSRLTKHTLVSV